MQHHKYSLTEIESMYPFEREVYYSFLAKEMQEEREKRNRER
jgi:hypothetical protein